MVKPIERKNDTANKLATPLPPPPITQPPTTPPPANDARKRNFLSPQKALAIQLAALAAILATDKIAALLTEEQKKQIKTANEMADELNSQTIKPVQDRINVIRKELTSLTTPEKLAEVETVKKVQEFASELSRLQKRLEIFTGAATATI